MRTRFLLPAVLSVVLALAACEFGRQPTDPVGRTVTQVFVIPDSVALDPQQSQQFQAKGITAAGDTVPAAVSWAASAGAITTSGMYTADASVNDVTVTATLNGTQLAGSGRVKKRRLVEIFLTPANANVQAGGSQQFTAYGRRNTGDSVAVNVSYAATGGSISAGGMYNAGSTVGAFRVIAQEATASLLDTSAVAVTGVAPPPPPPPANPGTVGNLAVASVTDSSVTLSFMEVTDGTGLPATYDVRWATGTLSWGSATAVSRGTCSTPLAGSTIGATKTCTVLGLTASTAYQFQLIAYRGTLNVDAVFSALSNVASGTTAAGAVSTAPVASVTLSPAGTTLLVGGVQQFTATLRDASGNVLTGRTIAWSSSAPLLAAVNGSGLATTLLAGVDTIHATSEGITGSATLTITPILTGGGVVFQSDWTSGTGLSASAISDGGRWENYWEFNNGTGIQLMSVVDGASVNAPGGRNALKVLQRGPYAANLQQTHILPPTTDYYVRFYMRNDDTSPAGDHVVTVDTWYYGNLLYVRKYSSVAGWTFSTGVFGCGYTYPIGFWTPPVTLSHGVWYRFEYYVHYVDPTHIQVHPRLYDAAGNLMYDDAGYRQSDFGQSGNLSWGGRADWTLASYYAAGYNFCVDPTYMQTFGVGNNGQQGAIDTGLPWYYTGIQIRTDHWVGP
jgi:hypothetical protein